MVAKKRAWMTVGVLIFLTACKAEPTFIHHTPPTFSVSSDVFSGSDQVAALGCDEIQVPSSLIGGLDPSYPIALCIVRYIPGQGSDELQAEIESQQFLYYTGGLSGTYVRYIIQRNGDFILLRTEQDFRQAFAPIESPEEALSYVLAVRNLSAYYGLGYLSGYKYEVNAIEDTYVTAETGGYLLHLFREQFFGCGPHWTSEVDVHVSMEGNVEERASKQLFRDPNMDDVCVD